MDYHGNWTCIAGLEGGFDPGQIIDSNCTHEPALFDSDWNSFLCISKTRTSYLGLYYDELLRVDSKLTPASTSPQGSYSKSNDYPTAFYRKIYKDGYPIKVVYNAYQGIYGTLNMPTSIQAGCVWSPVAFLKDSKSKCHKTLKPQLCSRNTLLDYQMYLMPLPIGNVQLLLTSYQFGTLDGVLKVDEKTAKSRLRESRSYIAKLATSNLRVLSIVLILAIDAILR